MCRFTFNFSLQLADRALIPPVTPTIFFLLIGRRAAPTGAHFSQVCAYGLRLPLNLQLIIMHFKSLDHTHVIIKNHITRCGRGNSRKSAQPFYIMSNTKNYNFVRRSKVSAALFSITMDVGYTRPSFTELNQGACPLVVRLLHDVRCPPDLLL